MSVVGLIVLLCVAVTGVVTVGAWMLTLEVRRATDGRGRHRLLPPGLVLGHMVFGIAAVTAWVCFVFIGRDYAGWISVGFMGIAAVLGITMFIRWIPSYRPAARQLTAGIGEAKTRENIPLSVVLAHGAFAVGALIIGLVTLLL